MDTSRTHPHAGCAIDASWFDTDLGNASATWRLMHAEEAASSGDFACEKFDVAGILVDGWPRQSAALLSAAWWVAEALWRNGIAASALTVAHVRRARQIGLAVLATLPATAPSRPATAVWLASELFDDRSRAIIRLQLARRSAVDDEAGADLMRRFSPVQARKLVGHARTARGAA